MGALFEIEKAALDAVAREHADEFPQLRELLAGVSVVKRENTGGGFFVNLAVADNVLPLPGLSSPAGDLVVTVEGLPHQIGLLLFLKDGLPYLLEGYSVAGDDTSGVDFESAEFGPIGRWGTQ